MMRSYLMLVVTFSVLLLAACQPVSPEQANADFCASLVAYEASLAGVASLTPESTVEEAEEAFGAVIDARDDVADAARILVDVNMDAVDEAYEDLDDAIRDIEQSESVGDAVTTIQEQLAAVRAAYDEVFSANCGQ
jgi:hypothetical protein